MMDDRTSQALERHIEQWIKYNVKAVISDDAKMSLDDDTLCDAFCRLDNNCESCPVFKKTGMHFCMGTPFGKAFKYLTRWRDGTGTREAFTAASQEMVDFLISLREEQG